MDLMQLGVQIFTFLLMVGVGLYVLYILLKPIFLDLRQRMRGGNK